MRFERVAIVLSAALACGCADFVRGPVWDAAETGEAGDDESGGAGLGYADDVHALLDSGCERCHAPANSAGNTEFLILTDDPEASLVSTLAFVDLVDPEASRLLSKLAGQGHGGGTVYDERSAEYELILAWIEQGAPP